mgnify:CR=1 FL=1
MVYEMVVGVPRWSGNLLTKAKIRQTTSYWLHLYETIALPTKLLAHARHEGSPLIFFSELVDTREGPCKCSLLEDTHSLVQPIESFSHNGQSRPSILEPRLGTELRVHTTPHISYRPTSINSKVSHSHS